MPLLELFLPIVKRCSISKLFSLSVWIESLILKQVYTYLEFQNFQKYLYISLFALSILWYSHTICEQLSMHWCKISEQRVMTIFGVPFQANGIFKEIAATHHAQPILPKSYLLFEAMWQMWVFFGKQSSMWYMYVIKMQKKCQTVKQWIKILCPSRAVLLVKTLCSKSFHQYMLAVGVCTT